MTFSSVDRTVVLQGETLAYRQISPPHFGAPRILCLHGWLDNLESFSPISEALAAHFEVVAVDLPGHGHSSHRAATDAYHAVDWLPSVMRFIDYLGWTKLGLIGHSMGSAIATLVAGASPHRFWGLVALDLLGPQATAPEQLPSVLEARLTATARPTRPPRPYASPEVAAKTLSRAVPNLSLHNAIYLAKRGMQEGPDGFYWRADPRLRAPQLSLLTEAQIEAFLGRIVCPLLFVRAIDGLKLEEKVVMRRLSLVAQGQRCDQTGGHHLHMERPTETLETILPFLIKASLA